MTDAERSLGFYNNPAFTPEVQRKLKILTLRVFLHPDVQDHIAALEETISLAMNFEQSVKDVSSQLSALTTHLLSVVIGLTAAQFNSAFPNLEPPFLGQERCNLAQPPGEAAKTFFSDVCPSQLEGMKPVIEAVISAIQEAGQSRRAQLAADLTEELEELEELLAQEHRAVAYPEPAFVQPGAIA